MSTVVWEFSSDPEMGIMKVHNTFPFELRLISKQAVY
jgi:hypothetical protein